MGIPNGVTAIVGSLNQGKSSLLSAIAEGVYNHVPGDGREFIVTQPDAVTILSEPGRSVHRVDISGFFPSLPDGQDPEQFSTSSADGPISQAASVMEMLEVGAGVLLFDEDSSAPEFFGANTVIDELAGETADAVRPLSQHLRGLWEQQQVSSLVVTRTAGDYLAHADLVLVMRNFQAEVVTEAAKARVGTAPVSDAGLTVRPRSLVSSTLDPSRGKEDQFIVVLSDLLAFGRDVADLSRLTQLVDPSQIESIGLILYYAKLRFMDSENTVSSTLDFIDRDLGRDGLECLSRELRGDLARPRRFEVAGAINRLRALRVHSGS
jgi:predicted ABC-class ATPase